MTKKPSETETTAKDLEPVSTPETRAHLEPVAAATLTLDEEPVRDDETAPRGVPALRRATPPPARRARLPVPRRQRDQDAGPSTSTLVMLGVAFVALLAWVLLH